MIGFNIWNAVLNLNSLELKLLNSLGQNLRHLSHCHEDRKGSFSALVGAIPTYLTLG